MNELVCTSCSKQRRDLKSRRSSLIKGMPILLCTECNEKGFEPRYVIIMAARNSGIERISDYLLKQRYFVGDKGPILAVELLS